MDTEPKGIERPKTDMYAHDKRASQITGEAIDFLTNSAGTTGWTLGTRQN